MVGGGIINIGTLTLKFELACSIILSSVIFSFARRLSSTDLIFYNVLEV